MQNQRLGLTAFLSIVLTLCLTAPTALAEFDDWITQPLCDSSQAKLCRGQFQPIDVHPNAPDDPTIHITSDSVTLASQAVSTLSGNVIAKQGSLVLQADTAKVYRNSAGELERIEAQGAVQIHGAGLRVDGDTLHYDASTNVNTLTQPVYRIYQRAAFGRARQLILTGNSHLQLSEASYTTCSPLEVEWQLKAKRVSLDKTRGLGEAWHAKIVYRKLPIFYSPYLSFSIDKQRKTGFLAPHLGSSSQHGKTIDLPYYLNLAPNLDALLTPKLMSKRGPQLQGQLRYLQPTAKGIFNLNWLPYDKADKHRQTEKANDLSFVQSTGNLTQQRQHALRQRHYRYRLRWLHQYQPTNRLQCTLNYNRVSDHNYLFDFEDDISATSRWVQQLELVQPALQARQGNHLLQQMVLSYTHPWGQVGFNLQQYQTLYPFDTAPGSPQYRKLPELSLDSREWEWGPFSLHMGADWVHFKTEQAPHAVPTLSTGKRLHGRSTLKWEQYGAYWAIEPRLQLDYTRYEALTLSPQDLARGRQSTAASRLIPLFDVQAKLLFERDWRWRQHTLTQTLTPKLGFLYVPNHHQETLPNFDSSVPRFDYYQVFRDNRYSGFDRIAEAKQLGIGLTSNLLSAQGETLAEFSIGRIRYLREKVLRLEETGSQHPAWSPLAMVLRVNLAPQLEVDGYLTRDQGNTSLAALHLSYRPQSHNVLHLGYELNQDPQTETLTGQFQNHLKQAYVGGTAILQPGLQVLGKLSYDLRFHRWLTLLAGIEKQTCCSAVRLLWVKTWQANPNDPHDYRHSIRLQFILKGLTHVGNASNHFISQHIQGYQPLPY